MSDVFKLVTVSLRRDIAIRLRVPADTPDEVVTGRIAEDWDDAANGFATLSGPDPNNRVIIVESFDAANDAIVVDSQATNLSPREARQVESFWRVEHTHAETDALTPSDGESSFTIVLTRQDLAAAGFCSDVDGATLELLRDVLEDEIQEDHFRAALVAACEELGIERADDDGGAT